MSHSGVFGLKQTQIVLLESDRCSCHSSDGTSESGQNSGPGLEQLDRDRGGRGGSCPEPDRVYVKLAERRPAAGTGVKDG